MCSEVGNHRIKGLLDGLLGSSSQDLEGVKLGSRWLVYEVGTIVR